MSSETPPPEDFFFLFGRRVCVAIFPGFAECCNVISAGGPKSRCRSQTGDENVALFTKSLLSLITPSLNIKLRGRKRLTGRATNAKKERNPKEMWRWVCNMNYWTVIQNEVNLSVIWRLLFPRKPKGIFDSSRSTKEFKYLGSFSLHKRKKITGINSKQNNFPAQDILVFEFQ